MTSSGGPEDHAALQKLRRNRQLTTSDLSALERMLIDSGVGEAADIERAADEAHGLGLFVRSLVGLDRSAAEDAFAAFLQDARLSVDQVRFVELIVEELTRNGVMEPSRLFESPFTDRAPTGPELLFPAADVDVIVDTLQHVKATAVPTEVA